MRLSGRERERDKETNGERDTEENTIISPPMLFYSRSSPFIIRLDGKAT